MRHRRRSVLSSSVLSSVGVALAAISRDFTYIKQKQACVCMCFSVKRESLSINFVTDHELGSSYAYQTFKRLVKPGFEHAEDIQSLWLDVKFPGNKQKPTPAEQKVKKSEGRREASVYVCGASKK